MLRLNPYQREIMDSLTEQGQAYLIPVVYACGARFPEQPPELLLRITIGAVCSLVRAGFIVAVREDLCDEPVGDERLGVGEVKQLVDSGAVAWSEELSRWMWVDSVGGHARVRLQLRHTA
jgi:hypothetical protein